MARTKAPSEEEHPFFVAEIVDKRYNM